MHDIKWIRANPEAFDAGMNRRGMAAQAAQILEMDALNRKGQTLLQDIQAQMNTISKDIGAVKAKGGDASGLMEQVKALKESKASLEVQLSDDAKGELGSVLCALPNLPAEDVPQGKDEKDNKEVRQWNAPLLPPPARGGRLGEGKPKEHFELGEKLGLMDFESAAKMSGARFVVLKGKLAKLERALAQFFLDHNTSEKFGYTEVSPPLLVKDNAAFGTGQLPKFGEDLFKTTNDFWLIPTAEVSLTNLVNDSILSEEQLPLRYTACTPCFRSEAGAAGKDTRGMIRQHQFWKVELVSITTPEQSKAEHERMTNCAEDLLQKLGLHYRVVLLCTGDMGFSSEKTYDIEVWLPGQNAYREISSCSNCGAFQARRMKARFKRKGGKEAEPVHTLNGSGLPLGRTLIAIMENYQNADGSITVPEVLRPYMGADRI